MKRFSIKEFGYDIDEVNRFIDIVIGRLEKLNTENAMYLAKIDKLNEELANKNKSNISNIENAILEVQKVSSKIKEISEEEARIIIDEAKNNANSIVHEALLKAEKTEHDRLVLEKNIRVYKERVKSLLESQLELVDDLDNVEL